MPRPFLVSLLAGALLSAQAPTPAPTPAPAPARDARAEAVIQKHLRVRGGARRLQALRSIRITGEYLLLPREVALPWRWEQARPNLIREELTVQGMVEVHTFNGTEGWVRVPWAADRAAKPMPAEQLAALKERDFDDPWIGALDHPGDLTYLGPSLFNRVPVLLVRYRLSPTDEVVGAFDQEVGLEVMRERVHRELGEEYKVRSEFQEWLAVDGLAFPFEVVHRALGRGARQKIRVLKIDLNPVLPEARFGRP